MVKPARTWKLKYRTIRAKSRRVGSNIQLEIRCPACKKKFWPWFSNVYGSKRWQCKSCASQSYRLPLGIKWRGRLTPVEFIEKGRDGKRATYRFKCDCGGEVVSQAHNCIQSCGCLRHQPRPKSRKSDNDVVIRTVFNTYHQSAKQRNLAFNLTLAEFMALIFDNCYYCGQPPVERTRKTHQRLVKANLNGIDRVDNAQGYTKINAVSCCTTCNRWKRALPVNDFLARIHAIAKLHSLKP